jgi:hypothetical protein
MVRVRVLSLALLLALGVVGIPGSTSAAARTPETIQREVVVERGTVAAAASTGVWFQRRFAKLPINANLVAASFSSSSADEQLEELILEARFRGTDGWSGWERLTIEPDEAPDRAEEQAASDRVFAGPIWVGTADSAELRYASPPGGATVENLRLHLVNTLGNASNPNLFQKIVGSVSSFFQGSKAHAMTTTPDIITRAEWGADESIRECCPRYAPAVNMAFVHHTAGTNSYAKSESKAIVRSVYAFHVKNRGWSDIGYNFLVDKYGQVFEGRYGGMTLPVIGAHVKGFNTGSTGISLMGTFTSSSPTSSMVSALKNLLAWKLDVHHVPPTGTVVMTSGGSDLYPVGTKKTFNRISGHKDGQQTSCPGSKAYNLLPSIRTAVSTIGLPKLYLPKTNTSTLTPDGDGVNDTVTLTGTFTTTVSWTAQFRTEAGTVLKTATGTGTSLSVPWNGRGGDGNIAPPGKIVWSIAGANAAGAPVRPASGSFSLVLPPRVAGDWDGDGVDTPGTVIGNKWILHNDFDGTPDVVFLYGQPTDRPVAGDWDGDGRASPGIVRGNIWYLNNGTDPIHDISFAYGWPTDRSIAGDWNGDGKDTGGIIRGNVWYLNDNFDAAHDGAVFGYGATTDFALAGDWDGNGKDTAGVVRANVWYLNNDRDGDHDVPSFAFGIASDGLVAGDWTESDFDAPGIFHEPMWLLLDENAAVEPAIEFEDLG